MQVLASGTMPPPSSSACSCVYVLKRRDGMFYCGQSDDLTSKHSSLIMGDGFFTPWAHVVHLAEMLASSANEEDGLSQKFTAWTMLRYCKKWDLRIL